jgi:hypothetical protein
MTLRICLILIAGAVGFWAGGLEFGLTSLLVQIAALGVFLFNIFPVVQEFQSNYNRHRRFAISGDLERWRPFGTVIFYVGLGLFGCGLFMILTAIRPRGHVIDVQLYLKYGVMLAACGLFVVALGRFLGRRK